MTSSDKLNQNSIEKKEKNGDAPKSKNSSPNSGMMGATAVLAAATIDEKWKGIGIRIEDDILVKDTIPEVLSIAALKEISDLEF